MTITITGERREGKSTLGQFLTLLLTRFGFEVEYEDVNRFATEQANKIPLDMKKLEGRHVIIKAT